jgi:hypothetical protein
MSLPDVVITGDRLSDVFFNYEHPQYSEFLGEHLHGGVEGVEKAIRADADEFCLTIGEEGNSDLAAALTADFIRRL